MITALSSKKSTTLHNSAFSGLDIWHSKKTTTPVDISLNSPSLSSDASTPTLERESFDSDGSITSFGEREFIDKSAKVISLGAPVSMDRRKSLPAMGGVLKQNYEDSVQPCKYTYPVHSLKSAKLFGSSLQRNRRMRARVPVPCLAPAGSPSLDSSSSDDDDSSAAATPPATPMDMHSTPVALLDISKSEDEDVFEDAELIPEWTLRKLQGLGLGVFEEEIAPVNIVPAKVEQIKVKQAVTVNGPGRVKMMSSSISIGSLASPNTLAELQSLRKAATDLETQVRRSPPATPSVEKKNPVEPAPPVPPRRVQIHLPTVSELPSISESPAAVEASRKIKRKAVPTLPTSGPSIYTPTPLDMRSASTLSLALETKTSSAAPHPYSYIPHSKRVAASVEEKKHTREGRGFYANKSATMSVMDISPRIASLPFRVPLRGSSELQKRGSTDEDSGSVTSNSSGSATSAEVPVTPSASRTKIYSASGSTKGAFMSMLDLSAFKNQPPKAPAPKPSPPVKERKPSLTSKPSGGFYASKNAFKSMMDLSSIGKKSQKVETPAPVSKRSISSPKPISTVPISMTALTSPAPIPKPPKTKRSFSFKFWSKK